MRPEPQLLLTDTRVGDLLDLVGAAHLDDFIQGLDDETVAALQRGLASTAAPAAFVQAVASLATAVWDFLDE